MIITAAAIIMDAAEITTVDRRISGDKSIGMGELEVEAPFVRVPIQFRETAERCYTLTDSKRPIKQHYED